MLVYLLTKLRKFKSLHSPPYEMLTNIRCLPEPFLRICLWGESNLQKGTTLLYVIVGGSGGILSQKFFVFFHP